MYKKYIIYINTISMSASSKYPIKIFRYFKNNCNLQMPSLEFQNKMSQQKFIKYKELAQNIIIKFLKVLLRFLCNINEIYTI